MIVGRMRPDVQTRESGTNTGIHNILNTVHWPIDGLVARLVTSRMRGLTWTCLSELLASSSWAMEIDRIDGYTKQLYNGIIIAWLWLLCLLKIAQTIYRTHGTWYKPIHNTVDTTHTPAQPIGNFRTPPKL